MLCLYIYIHTPPKMDKKTPANFKSDNIRFHRFGVAHFLLSNRRHYRYAISLAKYGLSLRLAFLCDSPFKYTQPD